MEKIIEFNALNTSKKRIDIIITNNLPNISRSIIQKLITKGNLTVNEKICKKVDAILKDEMLHIKLKIEIDNQIDIAAEDIPLEILYEDKDIIAINKKAGMVVHEGVGNKKGTIVNALLHHCKNELSFIGKQQQRPGIVHRLDKFTSGVMVACKNDYAHNFIAKQFMERQIEKEYIALCHNVPKKLFGNITSTIDRDRQNRLKFKNYAAGEKGKEAITNYKVTQTFGNFGSLITTMPKTGRTHQIRLHMEKIGCSIIGDSVYSKYQNHKITNMLKSDDNFNKNRYMLHAKRIKFCHPKTKKYLIIKAQIPNDIENLIAKLADVDLV